MTRSEMQSPPTPKKPTAHPILTIRYKSREESEKIPVCNMIFAQPATVYSNYIYFIEIAPFYLHGSLPPAGGGNEVFSPPRGTEVS